MKTCMLLFHDLLNPRLDPRVYKEAMSLIDSDIDVTVVCWPVDFSGDGEIIENLPNYEFFEGISIKRIHQKLSTRKRMFYLRIYQQLSAMLKLANEAIVEKPEIVHSHDLNTLLSGVIVKKKLKIPLIYDSHEYWPGMVKERNGFVLGKICKIFERILLSQVDSVITVSGELANKFKKPVSQIQIIYNSRKFTELRNINEDIVEHLKHSVNISNDDFVVGYIGNINSKRGLDKLIDSFKYINNSKIKLLIVGGGQKEIVELLKRKVNTKDLNQIHFTGEIPYQQVLPYFSLLDVGCVLFQPLPNHSVAAPNKLFEYMSMSIPLLVSDLSEMHHIVAIDSNCGICVDPTNPTKIADAITRLYKNRIESKKMGENGLEAFKEKYCWEKMEERLKGIYNNVNKDI